MHKNQRLFQIAGFLVCWFALIGQFYLIIENRVASVTETIVRYFGFFTILTNLMIALCFTFLLLSKKGFFHQVSVQTAIAVYILVVGLVYNFILRGLVKPEGFARLIDELLHLFMPLFYLCYWFLYGNKQALRWGQMLPWLLYPLLYVIYSIWRGSIVNYYPYPFLNADQLGYTAVMRNSILLTFVFVGFSLLFVAITRWKNGKPANR